MEEIRNPYKMAAETFLQREMDLQSWTGFKQPSVRSNVTIMNMACQ